MHDKGYFRNGSFTLILISTFLLRRHNGILKVSRWYVGDSTPAVEFDTSFPVKYVRIGVEKNNQPKKQQKKS